MSERAFVGSRTKTGEIISGCGLSCIFCGASILVSHAGKLAHSSEYGCPSWDDCIEELRPTYLAAAAKLMVGHPGWDGGR